MPHPTPSARFEGDPQFSEIANTFLHHAQEDPERTISALSLAEFKWGMRLDEEPSPEDLESRQPQYDNVIQLLESGADEGIVYDRSAIECIEDDSSIFRAREAYRRAVEAGDEEEAQKELRIIRVNRLGAFVGLLTGKPVW